MLLCLLLATIGCGGKKYDFKSEFDEEGFALVSLKGKAGFIDKSGKEVIPLIYDEAVAFSEGLATVELNGKNGFINRKGEVVIPLKYDKAAFFKGGIAWVNLNGIEKYVDKKGNEFDSETDALQAVGK